MGALSSKRCACCGGLFQFGKSNLAEEDFPARCSLCEHRDGLCQHNLFERVASGGANVHHSSRPCWREGEKCEWIGFSSRDATITRIRADRISPELSSLVDTLTTAQQS